MSIFRNGPSITGSNGQDIIVPDTSGGTDDSIDGRGGSDIIVGDRPIQGLGGTAPFSASLVSGGFRQDDNPLVTASTKVPWTILAPGAPGAIGWWALDVQAGDRVILDVDFGDGFSASNDLEIVVLGGDRTSVRRRNDDSGTTDAGSEASTGDRDPYLDFIAPLTERLHIGVGDFRGTLAGAQFGISPFQGDFLLHLSHSGGAVAPQLPGNDRIDAGLGDDTVLGMEGNDRIFGRDGDDLIFGGDGNDRVYGDKDEDQVHGGNGNDKVGGGHRTDTLFGDNGDDRLFGHTGDDSAFGGDGRDVLFGGRGADLLDGGNKGDTLIGEGGDDRLFGGNGSDSLHGNSGDDRLFGGGGGERMRGGSGDDTLDGGRGWDTLQGDEGADLFVFRDHQTGVRDQVSDLDIAEGDRVEFHRSPGKALSLNLQQVVDDTLVTTDTGAMVLFLDASLAEVQGAIDIV